MLTPTHSAIRGSVSDRPPTDPATARRHVAYFHALDAWTEYWDIYHPETRGRFYFGDGASEPGLLTRLLPHKKHPPVFRAWVARAMGDDAGPFASELCSPEVGEAVVEVDRLVGRLFHEHFGDASDPTVQADYLNAIFRFATNALPPATERDARIAADDPRKPTAGRHMLDGDLMWFAWSMVTEAAHEILGPDSDHPRRALTLAGVATGCPANFAWRGHRRTRPEYRPDADTAAHLHQLGLRWATDFPAVVVEVHALYRIREFGEDA